MSDTNDVGYRRPPKEGQFPKGRSGNPTGRPKGAKNFKTELSDELQQTILVREDGRAERISKQRAVIKTLVARTLKGDARSGSVLINIISRMLDSKEEVAGPETPLTPDESKVLEVLRRRAGAIQNGTPFSENETPPGLPENEEDER
jgi:hypothetical protein